MDDSNNLADDTELKYKYIISEDSIPIQTGSITPVSKRTLQSFIHFFYQVSGCQFLLSDIEYDKELKKIIKYKIHSIKENGYKKALEFFSSHICDNICKKLGLTHPRKKINPIFIKETFFSNRYLIDKFLCTCCSVPVQCAKKKSQYNCGLCSWKETTTQVEAICQKCQCKFNYSTYVYNCQYNNYPNKCPKCESLF